MKRNLMIALLLSIFGFTPLWSQYLTFPTPRIVIPTPPPMSLSFTGGSVWTSDSTGTCIWYFPVLADLPTSSLFASDTPGGPPVIDKEHAYFLWVSDWQLQDKPYENPGLGPMSGKANSTVTLANVLAGKATIYYQRNPKGRKFDNAAERSSWGDAIATFRRSAGLFQSPDGFVESDRFFFSAQIVNSETVHLPGRIFDFLDVMPYGMDCYEFGQNFSTTETGACFANRF